jgi:transposase
VYANRRRITGDRVERLLRKLGGLSKGPFAHGFETGAMRRTHLRGDNNILKYLLIHAGAGNLALLRRHPHKAGTPLGWRASPRSLRGSPMPSGTDSGP